MTPDFMNSVAWVARYPIRDPKAMMPIIPLAIAAHPAWRCDPKVVVEGELFTLKTSRLIEQGASRERCQLQCFSLGRFVILSVRRKFSAMRASARHFRSTHIQCAVRTMTAPTRCFACGPCTRTKIPGNNLETSGSVNSQEVAVSDCLIGSRGWKLIRCGKSLIQVNRGKRSPELPANLPSRRRTANLCRRASTGWRKCA